jgi:hypothetical protein
MGTEPKEPKEAKRQHMRVNKHKTKEGMSQKTTNASESAQGQRRHTDSVNIRGGEIRLEPVDAKLAIGQLP